MTIDKRPEPPRGAIQVAGDLVLREDDALCNEAARLIASQQAEIVRLKSVEEAWGQVFDAASKAGVWSLSRRNVNGTAGKVIADFIEELSSLAPRTG